MHVHAKHLNAVHADTVHAHAVHTHDAHAHDMHGHIMHAHVMDAHAMHSTLYDWMSSDMPAAAIVPKPVFYRSTYTNANIAVGISLTIFSGILTATFDIRASCQLPL